MTDKLKKQIILNLPYLIFVYLFDKLCQGVRLAPGADASEKLLHIGQGFSAAFASLAPSFHLLDLCVGVAGAVLIRLAVYSKGKNAKKYRRGIEYGSARWGTPADIAPYADQDFFQNVLLTQTERITMSSRPKEPKYARNKNILVIGGSGSGKTRFFVKPNLLQCHSSYVVTDPKGTIAPLIGVVVPVVLETDRVENQVIMDVVPVYVGGEDEFILAAQDLPRQLHADPVGLLRRDLPRFKRLDEMPAQVRALVDGMAAGPCKFDVCGLRGAAEGGHQQPPVRFVGIADIVDGRFQR